MECEKCGEVTQVSKHFEKRVKIPVFRMEDLGKVMAAWCIDIEGLANYLGMTVVFETFAEEDRDQDRKQLLQVISQLSDIVRNM